MDIGSILNLVSSVASQKGDGDTSNGGGMGALSNFLALAQRGFKLPSTATQGTNPMEGSAPVPSAPAPSPGGGFLSKTAGFAKEHPLQSLGALAAIYGMYKSRNSGKAQRPKLPEGWNTPLQQVTMNRQRRAVNPDSYYTYGEMPEQLQFEDKDVKPGAAQGGALSRYVSRGSGAPGRADNIDAKLSEGEYVIDSETVALLGDGSTDAGAKRLDQMRESIRSHKGKSLSKGKISPNAKSPLAYLRTK